MSTLVDFQGFERLGRLMRTGQRLTLDVSGENKMEEIPMLRRGYN